MDPNTRPEWITEWDYTLPWFRKIVEMRMRCLEKIRLTKHSDTYCQLPMGHPGEHSIINKDLIRCKSIHEGRQCEQPADHFGSHSYSPASAVKVLW